MFVCVAERVGDFSSRFAAHGSPRSPTEWKCGHLTRHHQNIIRELNFTPYITHIVHTCATQSLLNLHIKMGYRKLFNRRWDAAQPTGEESEK